MILRICVILKQTNKLIETEQIGGCQRRGMGGEENG